MTFNAYIFACYWARVRDIGWHGLHAGETQRIHVTRDGRVTVRPYPVSVSGYVPVQCLASGDPANLEHAA